MIRKTTWVVLLVFALLAATVFLWQRSQEEGAAQATPEMMETAERQYLFDIEGEVASLRIEHVGQKSIELVKDQAGQWTLTGSSASALDSAAVDGIISQLSTLPLVGTLQTVPELQDLGLSTPSYRILVVQKDGKQLTASVGKMTPTGSGYYVLSSDRRVYIANEFSLQAILDLVENPPYLPTPYPQPAEGTPGVETPVPTATSAP
jgi:hypothetical protein